ncbi:MAG: alpha/beta fold hydrolase [Rickettsiales endosymbiont of Dermacentor nuttalli]
MINIKNSGHFPFLEQPEQTKKIIEEFIKEIQNETIYTEHNKHS